MSSNKKMDDRMHTWIIYNFRMNKMFTAEEEVYIYIRYIYNKLPACSE
jgi:hypothetical protein